VSAYDFVEKDLYAVLGVAKDASPGEIKKAYRKLARELHPDKHQGDPKTEERFKAVSEAHDVLSDPERRKEYDEARALFASGAFRGGRPSGNGFGNGNVRIDVDDLLGAGGGGLGDLFGGLFGGGRGPQRGPRRGGDVETEVTLGFADAVRGVTVPLRLASPHTCSRCRGSGAKPGTSPRSCPTCQGSGATSRTMGGFGMSEPCGDCRGRGQLIDDPCPECRGTGATTAERTLTVRIPSGVADGQRIRLGGKGSPGERGAPAGDLYVVTHVLPHPVFGRKGEHLTVTLPVTISEAALGAELVVPTLDTPVTLRLAPGTSSGRTLRVKGRGVERANGKKGDLLVTVDVVVPKQVSPAAREALEVLAREQPGDELRAHLVEEVSERG
jgi:molecular chaperone DnaJ